MSFIATVTGKLPFAGRSLVENKAMEAICERDNPSEKRQKSLRAAGFLAVFAGLHGIQMKLGAGDFMHDYQEVNDQGISVENVIEAGASGLYTLANAMVTYTQFEISARVTRNYLRFRRAVNNGDYEPRPDYEIKSQNPMAQELIFTSVGQIVFLSMLDR